ncbi:hypothetical protein ID866_6189 [Astraeus odoratus]|nr:hypothetical protein ID866_6189 [Astraeus odoratus]
MAPVSTQPVPSSMPVQVNDFYVDEKHGQQCELHLVNESSCRCPQSRSHRACHTARLRRMLVPILAVLLALGALLLVWWMSDIDLLDALFGDGNPLALGKRQSTTSSGSSFTNNKLYLIVIFVGLLLVVIAGIMLSFWCLREPPLLPVLPVCLLWRPCNLQLAWSALGAVCVPPASRRCKDHVSPRSLFLVKFIW